MTKFTDGKQIATITMTDYAQSYVDGTNPDVDYTEDENGNVMDTHTTLTYTIESL